MATHNPAQAAKPLKPHKAFPEQLQLLLSRGLVIADEAEALRTLEKLGYYRLAGYFYPLRQTYPPGTPGRKDAFFEGASFELIADLYEFDKKLRLLTLDVVERLEVALRVCIAHDLGRLAPDAHRLEAYFDGRFTRKRRDGRSGFDDWQDKFNERAKRSNDDFVHHHARAYGGEMPIWVAIEIWDFGMLSRFYAGMRFKEKNRLAYKLGRLTAAQLESWLKTLNFVRNVAAHHSRLWNRNVPEVPGIPPAADVPLLAHLHTPEKPAYRLYGALCCAQYLLRSIQPNAAWADQLRALLGTFPVSDLVAIDGAGFPPGWAAEPLWS